MQKNAVGIGTCAIFCADADSASALKIAHVQFDPHSHPQRGFYCIVLSGGAMMVQD